MKCIGCNGGIRMNCGCSCGSSGPRGFLTREEEVEMLRMEYKETPESGAKGVEERIKGLQKKS